MIVRDVEVVSDKTYRVSDNPFTNKRVTVKSLNISDIDREYSYEEIERLSGRLHTGVKESARKAVLTLEYNVDKLAQAIHLRNQLATLFSGKFFLRELVPALVEIPFQGFNEPDFEFNLNYASGLQLEFRLVNIGDYDTNRTSGEIELQFETSETPYYQSIGRSLNLEKLDTNYLWSTDMGIEMPVSSAKRKYTFENVNSGNVYYYGTKPIDQFTFDRVVTITLGQDTKKFSWNLEHSEVMTIEGLNLKAGDTIKFDGLQTYRNGVSIDDYTRLSQPYFDFGWNYFTINQTVQKIVFDMKFYYR